VGGDVGRREPDHAHQEEAERGQEDGQDGGEDEAELGREVAAQGAGQQAELERGEEPDGGHGASRLPGQLSPAAPAVWGPPPTSSRNVSLRLRPPRTRSSGPWATMWPRFITDTQSHSRSTRSITWLEKITVEDRKSVVRESEESLVI